MSKVVVDGDGIVVVAVVVEVVEGANSGSRNVRGRS